MSPLPPPEWSSAEFEDGIERGIELFRERRLSEAREDYISHFYESVEAVESVLEYTRDLQMFRRVGQDLVANSDYLEALRYATAPPVSTEDLETLTGIGRRWFSAHDNWPTVINTVIDLLDSPRFPWVRDERDPTESERYAAVVGTAAQMAARRTMTSRAMESKDEQENLVKGALADSGFSEVRPRRIDTPRSAPGPGEFCGESMLGTRKADVVVGLWDDRILAIECKVSNSALNSIKRIKNDAGVKARIWLHEFGSQQIVPAAVIAGVFGLRSLLDAQAMGLTIWWSHDIWQLADWVERTKSGDARPARRTAVTGRPTRPIRRRPVQPELTDEEDQDD